MKICTKCGAEKKRAEFSRDKTRKDGFFSQCKACTRIWASAHRAQMNENQTKYHRGHMEQARNAHKLYRERHPERNASKSARRRAAKHSATPAWADRELIDSNYTLARLLTEHTGYEWHVDHEVPLKSDLVCGLHVEDNLRVIPGKENISKSNRYWPDMPEA